ncbi:L,D-transpeptidase family protein [Sphingomonas sp. CROZ-RG-20F-R02-07]|uniref:L,D-transpeptidase family protein n=1 Tax=Sphingomonas sp. CROZ-RG-20F-R02-07 TaxID=2914832 RepID=UPI001F57ECA2|nr:L,D-transpeptidase family protein [Sphingomonas sp. CROZ-RG-20F-R02-07]
MTGVHATFISIAILTMVPSAASAEGRATATAVPAETAALKSAVHDDAVRAFYRNAGWRPVWSAATSGALDEALAGRADHGLERVAFLPNDLASMSAAGQDVARTGAALDYAQALAQGRVDPAALHQVYTLPRPASDLANGLAAALAKGDLPGWFAGLAPQDAAYRQLSQAYRHESAQTQQPAPAMIGTDRSIHVGDSDPRVADIARQLTDGGYLSISVASGSDQAIYTQPVADAVEHLQRDYGIVADGIVGADTLEVLNLRPGDRARSLAVALERRRWLSRTPPATRIDVNTAAARLQYFRDGKLVDERKVIAGKPGKETPPLSAPIYRLVANPTWTVPKSIQNGDLAHVGSAYLRSHNMKMHGGWIVQQPGPDNALGVVKFDMKDDQAIYLHDTSNRTLFDRSQRHLSHGCVRVQDAPGFAQRLASDEGIADKWQTATATGKQTFVPLPTQIPVRLLYQNVFVDDGGKVAFRTDPYGWNEAVAERLGFAKSGGKTAKADDVDVGP